MGAFNSGSVRLKLTSASPDDTLHFLNKYNILLRKIRRLDELTVIFTAQRSDMERINQLVQSRGDQLELIGQNGVYWGLRRLIRRPLLICSVLFLIVMSMYLPTKVLFIQVEGNSAVPTNLILEQAADCGIRFGTGTRQVRSEKMKNALLQRIPQLQWAGINTSGCTAVISVREKTQSDKSEPTYPISSLVAIRDGYVTNVSVTAGSAACKIGQSVKAGQMLISAYTDCGLYIQAVRAKGEIFADTSRQSTVLTLSQAIATGEALGVNKKYAIIFGKNQINLSGDSGISGTTCDRIKSEYYITLPGGFQLPIGVTVITESHYETMSAEIDEAQAQSLLTDTARSQLNGTMVAGKILQVTESVSAADGAYLLEGSYRCNEMIGVLRTEEIMKEHE